MEFIYPSFLWALGALALPIIIHLFYFRRFKKVEFTNVRFLKEIKEETASRSKLKNLLVLLSRLLAIAFLVFAFAQPFLSDGQKIKKGDSAISIFVDNSFSMNALSSDIPLLDIAKEKARQVVNAYSESDQYQILTHDFEGRHQRLVSKEDALGLIDEIQITPEVKTIDKVINRQLQVMDLGEENKVSYVISDFQTSISDVSMAQDTSYELNLVPIQSVQEANISIDSAWFDSPIAMPNQNNKLVVEITNHSDEASEGVRLSMNQAGEEKPVGSFNIAARSTIVDTVNVSFIKTGYQDAILKVSDYPVQFDDEYYLTFYAKENIKVLSINNGGENRYLTAVFNGLNNFELTNQSVNQVQFDRIPEYDLIVLNDLAAISSGLSSELQSYIMNGGNALVFPSANADKESYNSFLGALAVDRLEEWTKKQSEVSRVNTDEFVFSEVFLSNNKNNLKLPITQGNYSLTNYQSRGQEKLLSYRDGNVYLAKYAKGRGNVYLSAAPLATDYNDIAINAEVFVPMLYKMALASGVRQEIAYTIGSDEVIAVEYSGRSDDIVYRIDGPSEFIPAQTNTGNTTYLSMNDQIKQAGFYSVKLADQEKSRLAFNYDRIESDLGYLNSDQLEAKYEGLNLNILDNQLEADLGASVSEKDKGIPLWRWCIILTLIFLAIEQLLLRFWTK